MVEDEGNPYVELIEDSNNDPKKISSAFSSQREHMAYANYLHFRLQNFPLGVRVDSHLPRIINDPGFVDERNGIVLTVRVSEHVRALAAEAQAIFRKYAPNIWTPPDDWLHLTVLEIAHSRTPEEIATTLTTLKPTIPSLIDFASTHPTRLTQPLIVYHPSAVMLTFTPHRREACSIHHLRRDLYNMVTATGVKMEPRWGAPMAHITLARYVDATELQSLDARTQLVEEIKEMNERLKTQDFEWLVSDIECMTGAVWYGSGERWEE